MDDGVGKTLREARTRRKIGLEQVEASTKIRRRFLQALENEEWDVLPGDTYTRGFIRTYAGYLGLDGARLAEEQRRHSGAGRPGERLPRAEPKPMAPRRSRQRRRLPPRAVAVVVSLALLGALVALGVFGGDGGGGSVVAPEHRHGGAGKRGSAPDRAPAQRAQRGTSLRLTATAEVWVCLLDASGRPLVAGQVLPEGAEAGPFRSDSFTLSLGNGEVTMTVNGKQASIPATSSPIGYTIGAGGGLRELPEGERPTCT